MNLHKISHTVILIRFYFTFFFKLNFYKSHFLTHTHNMGTIFFNIFFRFLLTKHLIGFAFENLRIILRSHQFCFNQSKTNRFNSIFLAMKKNPTNENSRTRVWLLYKKKRLPERKNIGLTDFSIMALKLSLPVRLRHSYNRF